MESDSVLDYAESYIRADFSVHPCKGKIPKISKWQERKLTLEEFKAYYQPGDNIGIVMGTKAMMVCIDIDPRNGGMDWYHAFKEDLGNPLVEKTGSGGLHLYYKYPQGSSVVGSKTGFAPGVDILSDGGKQVVTAPSIHECGGSYVIDDFLRLTDVFEVADFLPNWIVQALSAAAVFKNDMGKIFPYPTTDPEGDGVRMACEHIENYPAAIQGESGDEQTFKAASILWGYGLTAKTALKVLKEYYNPRCKPSWSDEGLFQKISNAYKYAREPFGRFLPSSQFEIEVNAEYAEECLHIQSNMQNGNKGLDSQRVKKNSSPPAVVISLQDFINTPFAKKEHYLGPFVKQGVTLVYAATGVGKTHFCMGVAFAIASGGEFLGWKCEEKAKVLYIDGELPAHYLQSMLKPLVVSSTNKDISFNIITPDTQGDGLMPNLATLEGQAAVSVAIDEADVIFVDNLSTLVRSGKENEAEYWIPMQSWFLSLRRRGKSVIFAHHAGKGEGGSFRGTSKITDAVDLAVFLKKPSGHKSEDGCVFEVTFPKYRHYRKGDSNEFLATYVNTEFGPPAWDRKDLNELNSKNVLELYDSGMKVKDIAVELECSQKTVYAHLKEAGISVKDSSKGVKSTARKDTEDFF